MKKALLFIIVLSCLLLNLSIGFAQDQAPVELHFTVWTGNEAHLAMLNGFATAFQETHPNVTVVFETIPFADYASTLTLRLAGTNPPDAGWLAERTALTFINAGVLSDLLPTLEATEGYDFADFSPSALELWSADGAVYGVPFSTSPGFIIFNRDIFTAAGVTAPDELLRQGEWTWESVAEIGAELTQDAPAGFYPLQQNLYVGEFWGAVMPYIWAYGGDAWTSDGECLLDSEGSVAGMQVLHDLIFESHVIPPPGEQVDFLSGQAAMTGGNLGQTLQLRDVGFEWGVVPLPAGPAGFLPVIGQAAIAAFNQSRHPEEAKDFIAFMTNAAGVATMSQFFPPARLSVLDSEAFVTTHPVLDAEQMRSVVIASSNAGRVLPAHPEFPKINLAAQAVFDTFLAPDADVAAVMSSMCDAIDPFLNP